MQYGFDPAKAASNLAKHGVAFDAVEGFDWPAALVTADTREHYGEVRLKALGMIGTRLYSMIYTIRRQVWIISLRRAGNAEAREYEAEG